MCAGGAKEVLLAFRLTWSRDKTGAWDFKSAALVIPKPEDKPGTRAWTKGCGYVEPRAESDQRIMDVATYARDGEMRVLYSTSLGAVTVVAMSEINRAWRMVSSLKHHSCPALAVDVLERSRVWACSGGTDGGIAVWLLDDAEVAAPVCVIERAHQSGVNALCISAYVGRKRLRRRQRWRRPNVARARVSRRRRVGVAESPRRIQVFAQLRDAKRLVRRLANHFDQRRSTSENMGHRIARRAVGNRSSRRRRDANARTRSHRRSSRARRRAHARRRRTRVRVVRHQHIVQ